MDRNDRRRLRAVSDEIAAWVHQAREIRSDRARIAEAAKSAAHTLRRSIVEVRDEQSAVWRVLILKQGHGELLGELAQQTQLPPLTTDEDQALSRLTSDAANAVHDARALVGGRRFVSGRKKRTAGHAAVEFLTTFHQWSTASGVPGLLTRLEPSDERLRTVDGSDALSDRVGLIPRFADAGTDPEIIDASHVADLPSAIAAIEPILAMEAKARADALSAGTAIRREETRAILAEMPVERLKEATRDRIRVGPLTDAGTMTVQAVLDDSDSLEYLPGIGETTARRIRGAARTLWQTTYDEMPIRIDVNKRPSQTTELLRRLSHWDTLRTATGSPADLARAQRLAPIARALDASVGHLVVFAAGSEPAATFGKDVDAVVRFAQSISDTTDSRGPTDPWDDFLARPADYFALLAELGLITEDEQKSHGDLPDDIIEAVRAIELDTSHLSASLRGYQSFGARFALVQRKVIIGDEMGLGKTIEALAVLTHLRAMGAHHAIVICPAAVVTNWVREVTAKSELQAHRVHGPAREAAARNWARNGGVAITTYETLAWFEKHTSEPDIACVVVDEAHYIKNPGALRSQRTSRLISSTERAILLTGTPLENRIDEFRNLVEYLRPDLVVDANELAPRTFRRQVAPAYLRRNQEDVLTELPDLVEVEEWLPMSTADVRAYREAVWAGNFMALRQAAMSQGTNSAKMQRLVEIVREAEDNSRRVIVFSHFRNVLDQIARSMPGEVFGPLTGSVPAAARQVMVDQFSAAGHGAVLVSQILAGGVGLNVQAASVVVICEPQLKPTTEWQAVARARRMGQVQSVQVHRLLSEEGVDLRVTEILANKRELFEGFARFSETASSAPEAFDVSEADLAREVVADERERLFSGRSPRPDHESYDSTHSD